MRNLTQEEISVLGDEEEGCIAIEGSICELALNNTGTACGTVGNNAFVYVGLMFSDNAFRFVRGWYDKADNTMCGVVHIQCEDEDTAERISEAASTGEGSLRLDRKSKWAGFYEFEIE